MSKFLSYLLILSFFFLNSLGTDSSPLSTRCPTHHCGNVTISYPFWVHNVSEQQLCGYNGFGVRCEKGKVILGLPGDWYTYYVKDINYTDYTLTLVDIDVTNKSCPRASHNVSLGTLPLKYSSTDLNLSFNFNCTSYPPTVPSIPCLNIGTNRSYVFVENHETEDFDWSKNCEEKVVVPVKQTQIDTSNLIGGFGMAMNGGFLLDWGRVKNCGTCERSGGYCGYNIIAEELFCFCNDGIIRSGNCKGMFSVIIMWMWECGTDMHELLLHPCLGF